MLLTKAQHHTVLRIIIQRIERLEAKAADRLDRLIAQRRLQHHHRQQRHGLAQVFAHQRTVDLEMVRQCPAGALHAATIQRI